MPVDVQIHCPQKIKNHQTRAFVYIVPGIAQATQFETRTINNVHHGRRDKPFALRHT